ncbi:MAG: Cof-type HAD-IIB family hydrolase [Thermoanaerobacteraceae bacterium]|nr:Cof-type HAD-IIB family hydrolase [Thermoanaerobacteraceae bacterium]
MYKLVAMDMDGTLLNSDKYISLENKRVLDEIRNSGIKISFCTGRLFTSARAYAKLLGGDVYIISCNGAYITDEHYNGIAVHPVGIKESLEIVDICRKYDTYYYFFDRYKIYSEKEIYGQSVYLKGNDLFSDEDKTGFVICSDLKGIINTNDTEILKYVILDEDMDKLKKVRNELKQLNLEISSSLSNNIEITAAGVNKGAGLRELIDFLGIKKDEVIAIGDSENDIPMLKMAGIGVAMENARDDVKEVSDYITATEDNDGVAKALKYFIMEVFYGNSRH